jgi:hypothetical protein
VTARGIRAGGCGNELLRVDVDGVPAHRLHDGHADVGEGVAQVAGGAHSVLRVVLIHDLLKADGDGLQVASGKPLYVGNPSARMS